MKRKIDIICFSSTGNTKLVTDIIANSLANNDFTVNRVSVKNDYVHEKGTELLLAFPVNSQAVSPYIWKFFKLLPDGCGDKVHVVVTLNETAVILNPLKKLLDKKGYVPQGAAEISMPNNLLVGPDTTFNRLQNAENAATRFADSIINNSDLWNEDKKGSAFVSFLSRKTSLPWVSMRIFNKLEVDTEKCIKCGLCVKECPVNNIRMEDFPVHLNKCQFCMHCGAVCKKRAVHIKGRPQYQIRNIEQCEQK